MAIEWSNKVKSFALRHNDVLSAGECEVENRG